jgi:arginase
MINPFKSVTLLGIAAGRGAASPGAEEGPYELRQQGLVERLVNLGLTVDDLGDIPGVYETRFANPSSESIHNLRNILQVNRHIHACVLGTRRKQPDSFLLVVGGDHSLAIGTLAGLSDSCQRLGLLWIDAHADFNTPYSSPSGNAHGMGLAVACGRGNLALRQVAERDPLVLEQDVFLFGPRDIDPGELEELSESDVHLMNTSEFRKAGVVRAALQALDELAERCDHIHLSFDIDVLDEALVPGTGTRVDEGLSVEEAIALLAALGATRKIDSAEFVEYNPELDEGQRTGLLTISLIETLLRVKQA